MMTIQRKILFAVGCLVCLPSFVGILSGCEISDNSAYEKETDDNEKNTEDTNVTHIDPRDTAENQLFDDTDIDENTVLIHEYMLVAAPGIELSGDSQVSMDLSTRVTCVTAETLRTFIEENKDSISPAAYQSIVDHPSFKSDDSGADILLTLLGEVIEGDTEFFTDKGKKTVIESDNEEKRTFLEKLNGLVEKEYELSGKRTAVSLSFIRTAPRFYAKIAGLKFPSGATLRAVNTTIIVADINGQQTRITGKKGEAPFELIPVD